MSDNHDVAREDYAVRPHGHGRSQRRTNVRFRSKYVEISAKHFTRTDPTMDTLPRSDAKAPPAHSLWLVFKIKDGRKTFWHGMEQGYWSVIKPSRPYNGRSKVEGIARQLGAVCKVEAFHQTA